MWENISETILGFQPSNFAEQVKYYHRHIQKLHLNND